MKNKCKDLFYLYLASDWIQIRVSDQQTLFSSLKLKDSLLAD